MRIKGVSWRVRIGVLAVTSAVAAGGAVPAFGAGDLDELKQELEQQKNLIKRLEARLIEQENMQQKAAAKAETKAETKAEAKNGPAGKGSGGIWSNVEMQVYGLLNPALESVSISSAIGTAPPVAGRPSQVSSTGYTGINQPNRMRVLPGVSNLGFRGSVALPNDLKAIWQVEAGITVDGDQAPAGPANGLGTRNTHVGLSGAFGTVFAGVWDTPYKWVRYTVSPLRGALPGEEVSLLGNPGFGVIGTTMQSGRVGSNHDASFDRRQGNSIQYWSPTIAGFSGRFAYSPGEGRAAANAAASTNPTIWSLAASYENGPFVLRYAYEQHNDYFGMVWLRSSANNAATAANQSSRDMANKLTGAYSFGNTRLTATYERLSYKTDDTVVGNVNQYDRNAYYLTGEQRFGAGKAWLGYGRAGDGSCAVVGGATCQTDGLGARYWMAGYAHTVAQNFDVFGMLYGVNNDESGGYGIFPPVGSPPVKGLGAKTNGFGLGVVAAF